MAGTGAAASTPRNEPEHLDVVIVGAGISGIGAGYHLQRGCPTKSWAILEGRADLGGTWDLFRYPGVRSDSDMHTLGYSFRPWTDARAIADGPAILSYLRDTAHEFGIDQRIRYQNFLRAASWSSDEARWTLEVEQGEDREPLILSCSFLFMCTGYYDYRKGYEPAFPGRERFGGRVVHPQKWPEDLDYADQRVVVIGSGATAVTLVPEMAKEAASVTMLQRSPTYVVSRPAEDGFANRLRAALPSKLAYGLTRWKNILLGQYFYRKSRREPERVKQFILDPIREELGDEYVDRHFTPDYKPWDQRLCLVPDGDLFRAIREGSASVVTDEIETFTETGIALKSGEQLEADLVVTATGLEMQFLSDIRVTVDGTRVHFPDAMTYKGMMMSDVPNLAWSMGYTNASWTLKCDLTCGHVCRLLNYMDRHGFVRCTPRVTDPELEPEPIMDLTSGYVQRAVDRFPRQGSKAPWKLYQNYSLDLMTLKFGRLDDGVMEFSRPGEGLADARVA